MTHEVTTWNITRPPKHGGSAPPERHIGLCTCGRLFGPTSLHDLEIRARTHMLVYNPRVEVDYTVLA